MTLDEAIAHAEEVAADCENDKEGICELLKEYPERRDAFANDLKDYNSCAAEHRQLAEWLRELKERRKQPEIIRCKDCVHYHTDVFGGELGVSGIWENIIVAHNACDKWAKGMNCVTPDGFCFLAERRADDKR